jgi:hypothetical protein
LNECRGRVVWYPHWRVQADIDEFVSAARIRVEPVTHVAFVRQTGKPHDADCLGAAVQRCRGVQCLFAAGGVVIFMNETISPGECFAAVGRPFARRRGGCAVAETGHAVGILLAFAHKYGGVGILDQFRPSIWHSAFASLP